MSSMDSNPTGRRRIGWIVIVILAVVAVFALRFHTLSRPGAVASVQELRRINGVPVEIIPAEEKELSAWTTLAGTVKGVVQYPVVSNNSLRVQRIPVREGSHVDAGDVVLHFAQEAPSPMFHSVPQAQAGYDNALADVERLRNLHAEGAVSRQALDHAETRLAVATAQLAEARSSTSLTASQPGVVTSVVTEVGATVSAGRPLIWIARTDTVKATFQAGSRQALELAVGQQAVWKTPEGAAIEGVVGRLDLMADPSTHLLEGEALFANPDGRLLPGLLISFDVRTRYSPDALAIPRESLVSHDGGWAVWVIYDTEGGALRQRNPGGGHEEDHVLTVRLRPVTVGMMTFEWVEIASGLVQGEFVVRHGQSLLADGARVQIVTPGEEG